MDPVGVFLTSVCSRDAVIGCRYAERKSLRCVFEGKETKAAWLSGQRKQQQRLHFRQQGATLIRSFRHCDAEEEEHNQEVLLLSVTRR
ncbi:hypothetical protein LDENG_00180340 [Lucifuga dentata]|nr:hypothetical protein LDENG_00180340 [Lucifuga dentata]